jgi:tetratricopeptide (TPR) repeat protein
MTALCGVTGAAILAAPGVVAQTSSTPEFVNPYKEANAALKARRWADAIAKADQASPHAKSQQEKLGVASLRVAAYAGSGNKAKQIEAMEQQIATGGLNAAQVRATRQGIIGLYSQLGQDAKAVQLTREFINSYGGTSDLYAYLASEGLKSGDRKGAIDNAQKAIDAARKEGKRPSEKWHNIIMKANFDAGNLDAYYAALERAVLDFPKDEYWRALIVRAEKAPKFRRTDTQLDISRAMQASKIKMKLEDLKGHGEQALSRRMPIESEAVMKPLFDNGTFGGANDKNAARNKSLLATAAAQAKSMREAGLAAAETAAATAPTGAAFAEVGEAYMTAGDHKKAIELMNKGIAKGGLPPEAVALVQLRLGIAQLRSGDKEGARKTWAAIKADNGAQELAKAWTLISRT